MGAWDTVTGRADLRLAVNISAMQVAEGGLVAMADRLLEECQFDPRRLDSELSERAAMRASPSAVSSLDALRSRGITLTLDDFGTGYSALSRLERLPIDAMKVDKSFLENAGANGVITRAIIAMGHALGMTIVGEGVETHPRPGCGGETRRQLRLLTVRHPKPIVLPKHQFTHS